MPVAATTRRRVPAQTAAYINRRIDSQIERNVRFFSAHPGEIDRRLTELDQEWDIERVIQANAATLALAGTILGLKSSHRFLLVPALVTGFLLQHAIQGWCPPLPFLRRAGVRTAAEIETERNALKALRGDFYAVGDKKTPTTSANAALKAVNA